MTYAPKLVIHGGAGRLEGDVAKRSAFHAALDNIVRSTYAYLEKHSAHETAVYGIHLLEDNLLFNAGTGSKLQKDGTIRMSSAIMLGKELRFAGVVNVENVQHPIDLADHLLEEENTVLAGVEATQYARSMGLPEYDCLTETRHREYENRQAGKSGTVGVVALDPEGAIVAATSSGGRGYEIPGRVSDTPTVAGNYATQNVGISATGLGEEIVHTAAAARVACLVDHGINLAQAVNHVIALAKQTGSSFGLITLDKSGHIIVEKTTEEIFYAWHDGDQVQTFFNI